MAEREGRPRGEPFPSLIVSADGIQAKGSYAEAQVELLLNLFYVVWYSLIVFSYLCFSL